MALERYIARRLAAARLALFWEVLWPASWPSVVVVGLFIAAALMGLPAALPGWLHVVFLVLFASGFLIVSVAGVRRLRLPSTAAAARRLEASSSLTHRPLLVIDDNLATGGSDQGSENLWRRHQARMRASVRRLRVSWPRPGLAARDRYAVRAVVFLALAIGIAVGGYDAPRRLASAFSPNFSGVGNIPAELEVWVNPPAYTRVAPMRLTGAPAQSPAQSPARIPAGSAVLGRVFGGQDTPEFRIDDRVERFRAVDALNHEIEYSLDGNASRLAVHQDGRELASWAIEIVADHPPRVALVDVPAITARGAIRLDYDVQDDYGVVGVKTELRLAEEAAVADDVVELPLPLAGVRIQQGRETSFHDLTPHPWAGLAVRLQLVARDERDQEGRSVEHAIVLPERAFAHPVARAVIEQRKRLVREPEKRRIVAMALRAVGGAPESYDNDVVVYLSLRAAATRLRLDSTRQARFEVVDLLWDTALRIEDGGLSIAERELRAAQRELMDALARDASEEEIERLMDKLQQSMQRYLQALAEQSMQMARQGAEPRQMDPQSQVIEAEQLRRMLDQAREMSRLGARDAAREMLRQLQQMLENLRAGPMTAMPQDSQGAQQALRDLGDLIRRQQRLLDQTFRQSQQPGQQGRPGERGERGGRDGRPQPGQQGGAGTFGRMAGEQEALRRALGDVMRQLGEQFGDIPGPLGRAERAMRDSREALSGAKPGPASGAQTRAIDQMAEGLRGLAEELARQFGEGEQGMPEFGRRDEDPLGRPTAGSGLDSSRVAIPEQADLQRAREILDELRRRAGQRTRPPREHDYIERLLRQF